MKRCPQCNNLMPDDVLECIRCGHDSGKDLVSTKASTPNLISAEPKIAQQPNAVSQTERARKQKYWGLGLVAFGLVFQILSVTFGGLVFLIVGLVLGGIGLAYFAHFRGRSVAWGAFAFWPFVGAIAGLLALAIMKRPNAETSQSKSMSARQLKWGWLLYVGVLWFVPLQVYLVDGLTCVSLPNKLFPPLSIVEGSGCGFASFSTLAFAFVAAIVFLHGCGRTVKAFGVRSSARWLAIRAAVIGLTLTYTFSAFDTSQMAAGIVEARTTKSLAELQVGMTKEGVERVILDTNASLVPPAGDTGFRSRSREEAEYEKVRNVLSRVKQGASINFSDLHFHRALFNVNLDSLDQVAGPKPSDSQTLFARSCCQLMFGWTRYDLFVDYDRDNQLKSARYTKSNHEDGEDHTCVVLLEVPPAPDLPYPHACPSNVKGARGVLPA